MLKVYYIERCHKVPKKSASWYKPQPLKKTFHTNFTVSEQSLVQLFRNNFSNIAILNYCYKRCIGVCKRDIFINLMMFNVMNTFENPFPKFSYKDIVYITHFYNHRIIIL